MHRLCKKSSLSATLLLLSMAALAGTGWAQARRTRDPLAGLKRALQEAGAAALTSAQENNITALITAFRAAHEAPPTPGTEVQNARAKGRLIWPTSESKSSKSSEAAATRSPLSLRDSGAAAPCDCCSVWPAARALLAGSTSV